MAAATLLLLTARPGLAGGQVPVQTVTFSARTAVPQVPCRAGDRPETGLRGRVPPQDIVSGRAAKGYTCNLSLVGHAPTTSSASLDSYGDCAYVGREVGAGGVLAVDVSDPAHPVPTDVLATPAMLDPWESLRVNVKRGLLAAAGEYKPFIDLYDVSQDCRHPRLLASKQILPGKGHEGWFSPDGETYFVSTTRTIDGAGLTPTLFPVESAIPRTRRSCPRGPSPRRHTAGRRPRTARDPTYVSRMRHRRTP